MDIKHECETSTNIVKLNIIPQLLMQDIVLKKNTLEIIDNEIVDQSSKQNDYFFKNWIMIIDSNILH